MGQRPPAEPARAPSTTSSPPATSPWVRGELARHRVGQRDDRRLGEVAIALGDGDRVAVRGDQLHAQREAPLADHPPHAVERDVERVAGDRGEEALGQLVGVGRRKRERTVVDQPVEQGRPPRQLVGERRRMGEDQREQVGQLRPRLEQAVEIDPARQPLDDIAEAVERADGSGPAGDRAHQVGQHRLERRARRRRAQRPRPARAPVADPPQRLVDVVEAHRGQLGAQDVGVVRQPLAALGRRARRTDAPTASTWAAQRRRAARARSSRPSSTRDRVERRRIAPAGDAPAGRRSSGRDARRCAARDRRRRSRRRRPARAARPRPARPARRASPARAAPARARRGSAAGPG